MEQPKKQLPTKRSPPPPAGTANEKEEGGIKPSTSSPPRRAQATRGKTPPKPTVPGFLGRFFAEKNPGKFDNLFSASQDILDAKENFDGIQIILNRFVSQDFEVGHSIHFGSQIEPPGYSFSTSYKTKTTQLVGRFVPATLSVQGRIQHIIWNQLFLRLIARVSPQPGQSQTTAELDWKHKDFTVQAKYHHAQAAEVSYTQTLNKTLQAGILGFFDMVQGRSGWKAGLKWASSWGIWAFSYSSIGNITASFTQIRNARKFWTTDMEFVKVPGQDTWEAIWAAGFQYNLLGSLVKGRVDSHLRASVFVEEKFNESIDYFFCVEMDYLKDNYKFGIGCNLNG